MNKNNASFDYFDSLSAYKEEADKSTRRQARNGTGEGSVGDNWFESDSYEHYCEMMETGYELDMIDAGLKGISTNDNYDIQPTFDVSGSDVDMGRYMSGEPECMIEYQIVQSYKYVNIVIGAADTSGMGTKRMLRRMIAITSIIDRLQNDNYRVKLSVATTNIDFGGGHHNITVVKIKDYDEPTSIVRLAAIAHPSYHRRLTFIYRGGHREYIKNGGGGMGCSGNEDTALMMLRESGFMQEDYIYLPSVTEMMGGANLSEVTFREDDDAKVYADYIVKHIDKLSIDHTIK